MDISRKTSAAGQIPLSFNQDQLDYLAYVLNMSEWVPNKEVDPIGHAVYTKIKNAGKFAWKY